MENNNYIKDGLYDNKEERKIKPLPKGKGKENTYNEDTEYINSDLLDVIFKGHMRPILENRELKHLIEYIKKHPHAYNDVPVKVKDNKLIYDTKTKNVIAISDYIDDLNNEGLTY